MFEQLMLSGFAAVLGLSVLAVSASAQPPTADQLFRQFGGVDPGAASQRGIKMATVPKAPPTHSRYRPTSAGDQKSGYAGAGVAPPAAKIGEAGAGVGVAPPSAKTGEVDLDVTFPTGSWEVTPAAKAYLDPLGEAISAPGLANYRFRIEGHTDTVGLPEANQLLSQRRAESVVAYLTDKFDVDPGRLDSVGLGQSHLRVNTPPQTANKWNRRVHIVKLAPLAPTAAATPSPR